MDNQEASLQINGDFFNHQCYSSDFSSVCTVSDVENNMFDEPSLNTNHF
jgi:hypothetical protein